MIPVPVGAPSAGPGCEADPKALDADALVSRKEVVLAYPVAVGAPSAGPGCEADPAALDPIPLFGPKEVVRVTPTCTACGACLATCPERALRRAPKRPLVVDEACTACWACIEICPAGAIEAVWATSGATLAAGGTP